MLLLISASPTETLRSGSVKKPLLAQRQCFLYSRTYKNLFLLKRIFSCKQEDFAIQQIEIRTYISHLKSIHRLIK